MPAGPHRFLFLLDAAHRALRRRVGEGDGPGAARASLLVALPADPADTPMAQVAAALDLGASALTGLVDRAVADGLLQRIADPDDRRACRLRLTDAGTQARAAMLARVHALNAELCAGFTPLELDTVARWLAAVRTRQGATR